MDKSQARTASIFAILAGGFILVDLVLDRLIGGTPELDLPHIIFATLVVMVSFVLLHRALEMRRSAEGSLRQARDELEIRVKQRTTELKQANEALQSEISAHRLAEDGREQMELALRESEETARALMNASSESAMLIDPQGVILATNEISARRMGTTTERMVGSSLFGFFSTEVAARRRSYLDQVLQTGQPAHFEDERDGMLFDIYVHPVFDLRGNIIRLAIFAQDITERRLVENALRESEEKYRTLFDNFPEPTTVWDQDGVLLMQNLVSARNLGGQREDYLGKTIFDIFGDAANGYMERMARVIETGVSQNQEDVIELHLGRRYFWTCMQRIQYPAGHYAVQVISYDISGLKQTEESLRASEEKFATVFNFSPEAIMIIRAADGLVLDVNQAFSRLFGYERRDAVGKTWTELNFISLPEAYDQVIGTFQEKGLVTDYELDFPAGQVGVTSVLLSLTPIIVSGEPSVLVIGRDITGSKKSEMELQQAQAELARGIRERATLEERQRLARELHDSVSQVLYGIALGVNTALTLFETDRDRVREALNYALSLTQTGLAEMRALIFELRPEVLERGGLVDALNQRTVSLRAQYDIEVELSLCDEPGAPQPIKEAIYRIALEALQNAIKHAQATRLEVRLTCEADNLILEVRDNGKGFEPQAEYPGHMGLRSMRERALRVGGNLDITSAPGSGTLIYVRIPEAK